MATFQVTECGYTIELSAHFIGDDLLVEISGGTHPHIGTITTCSKETVGKEVIRFPSHSGRFHKDDILADIVLEEIGNQLPQNCVITSGVHVDGITQEQIQAAFSMTQALAKKLAYWLREEHKQVDKPCYKSSK